MSSPAQREVRWLVIRRALAIQLVIQGGQYVIAPERPYVAPQYEALRVIGLSGWAGVGWAFVGLGSAIGTWTVARVADRLTRWRAAPFLAAAVALVAEIIGALLSHFYLAATLVLPVTVALLEADAFGKTRHLRRQRDDRARQEG